VVPQVIGGGTAPIVDTWWQTETGGIMITPAARASPRWCPARRTLAHPRHRRPRSSTTWASRCRTAGRHLVSPSPGRHAARHLGRPERYKKTYWSRWPAQVLLRRRRRQEVDADGYIWLTRPHRRRHERLGPPPVHRRDRVGPGQPPEGGRGRGGRRQRRHHRPGDRRLRHPARRPSRADDDEAGIVKELRNHVAKEIGPIAKPKHDPHRRPELPKTRSGKIMRRLLRDVAEPSNDPGRHVARSATAVTTTGRPGRPEERHRLPLRRMGGQADSALRLRP
jgi:acetyl-CoA synthetase